MQFIFSHSFLLSNYFIFNSSQIFSLYLSSKKKHQQNRLAKQKIIDVGQFFLSVCSLWTGSLEFVEYLFIFNISNIQRSTSIFKHFEKTYRKCKHFTCHQNLKHFTEIFLKFLYTNV